MGNVRRRLVVLWILLVASAALPGLAQTAGPMPGRWNRGGDPMQTAIAKLNLTDEQKPKVKAVLDDSAKKMQDLAPEDRREKGRAIREEETTKLKEILTPEQMDKYTKMQEEMRKKGGKKKTTE